jgi:L-lactate utilization protein LutB
MNMDREELQELLKDGTITGKQYAKALKSLDAALPTDKTSESVEMPEIDLGSILDKLDSLLSKEPEDSVIPALDSLRKSIDKLIKVVEDRKVQPKTLTPVYEDGRIKSIRIS